MKRTHIETGQILVYDALQNCIKKATKKALQLTDNKNRLLVDLIMDYYATYNQLYELDINPTGSYISINKKIESIKETKIKLASKIELLLD